MNIGILHHSVPPVVGGVESVIAHHARLMAANGHSVRLIAGRGEALGEDIPLISIPLADSVNPRVLEVQENLNVGILTAEFDLLCNDLVSQLRAALSELDIIIAHNVCSLNKNLALTAAIHKLHSERNLPCLILWHHDLAWKMQRYLSELHDGYPWDLLCTDWGRTQHVVVSELRRQELVDLMKLDQASVRVIPNGVDAGRFYKFESQTKAFLDQTQIMDAAPILLLPVRITKRKNIELALQILAELHRHFPQAALVVTGPLGPHSSRSHEYFDILLDLRAQLGLQHSAFFLAELSDSFLPDEVIADFYRIADALLFPSREEGFGIPLIEAAFSHLPAFCADIPPLRDLGLNDVYFFSVDEKPLVIADAIAEYFQTSAPARLALRARTTFRWEAIYQQHIAPLLSNVEQD